MSIYHILDERRQPVPVPYQAYIAWLAAQPSPLEGMPHVGRDQVETPAGPAQVSTIFLGIDLSMRHTPEREFFETMITSTFTEEALFLRYPTWDDAERGHQVMVQLVAAGKCPWPSGEADSAP